MIITDINQLKIPCIKSNNSLEDEQKIAKELFRILVEEKIYKLACNQIGITDHRIAVINVREPLYFVNPKIISYNVKIPFLSDDISFPRKIIKTIKFAQIVVSADNFKKPIVFGLKDLNENIFIDHPRIIEVSAIQHVVDLLNGITMYDRKMEEDMIKNKIYRNQIVTLSKNGEIIQIKFKKAASYLNNGWKILDN